MISISLLALGAIAAYKMPLKFLPKVDRPVIGLHIPYPGGTPAQVEQQIAIPVEGEMRTIPGLRRLRTTSDGNGCRVFMLFNLDVDMTLATAEVRDRIERLKLVLPDEADRIMLQRFSSGSIPVMAFGLFSDEDAEEYAHRVRTIIEPRIRRIDGVANVDVLSPVAQREVLVEFDQDTLKSLNLDLAQVISTLQRSSFNLSVGELADGDKKYLVRTLGEYRRIEEIERIVIGPHGLQLSDVAEVTFSHRTDQDQHVSLDGKDGVVLLVIKESEANTVETCRAVHREIEEILALPTFRSTIMKLFFDQSDLITRALNNLLKEGVYGGAMALVVLFVFLHRVRPTVIVALTIPTSLVIALVFMFFIGMSLNLVTMVSMIISVGMLVDNSIVVVENIIRRRQLGEDRFSSAEHGAMEVGMAILAATTTTWVVFVPMYYLETGRMSVFMQQLGGPLIVALGGSLVIALTAIPLAMSRMQDRGHHNVFHMVEDWMQRKRPGSASRGQHVVARLGRMRVVQTVIDAYARLLDLSLRWRLASFALLGLLVWLTLAVPVRLVGMRDLPKLDTREVAIEIDLEQNFDMAMARALFTDLESQIEQHREYLGVKNILSFHGQGGGQIEVYLYTEDDDPKWSDPDVDTEEALAFLQEQLPKRLPGAEVQAFIADAGESGTARGVSLEMRGDDSQLLERYALRFKKVLERIPDLYDVSTDIEQKREEMQLRIDEPLADQAGVSPMVLAQTVDAALRGARLPFLKQGGREIPVWAQFREEDRKSRANLDNVMIMGQTGKLMPLNLLVDYLREPTPAAIQRLDGKNVIEISAKTRTEDLTAVRGHLQRAVDAFYLPLGYSINYGQEIEELGENMFQFWITLMMAVILIFLVMSALFESLLLPLAILSSVPLALGGSMWMMFFTGTQLDTFTLIGNILMVGIIVNNGIVIVDHINQLRKRMPERNAAIVQAGLDRFRPVMMTAITTILGLVPLATATTGGAATFAGLGRSLIGGLTAGTLLTLFVVPLFFTVLDDLQKWCVNFFGGLISMGRGIPAGSDGRDGQ